VDIGGDLTLGGTLALEWLPVAGDPASKFGGEYDVIVYGAALTGSFDAFGGDIGGAYLADVDYEAEVPGDPNRHAVRITLHDLIDADTDLDGDVDYYDYAAARDAFATGGAAEWAGGDSDLDGDLDALDYLALKMNYGHRLAGSPPTTAAGPAAGAAIPEPATLSLLALGALAFVGRRQSAHRRSPRPEPRRKQT